MTGAAARAISGSVRALASTPVKGLRLGAVSEIALTDGGAVANRCFYVIDERGRMVNGKQIGALMAIGAEYDPGSSWLRLRFPGERVLEGEALAGERVQTRFFSRPASARLIAGSFSRALSEHAGVALRLVAPDGGRSAVDRGRRGGVSLISTASIAALGERAGTPVDPRRFRMLIEVGGLAAHEEDLLVGCRARIGEALVAFHGHVGRCLVTSRDPDTGRSDLPTLDLLRCYRAGLATTEPLAFGVYGEVVQGGRVRVGDPVCGCP